MNKSTKMQKGQLIKIKDLTSFNSDNRAKVTILLSNYLYLCT